MDDEIIRPARVTTSHAGNARAQGPVSTLPRIAVTGAISASRGTISGASDVAGVDDVVDTGERLQRLGTQQSVGVRDDADDHGRFAPDTSSGCQGKSSW